MPIFKKPEVKENKLPPKIVVFSQGWDGAPVGFHLFQEGLDTVLAQIQDIKELKNKDAKEETEDKEHRLEQYDGLMDKKPAQEVLAELLKANPDDYFVFFDQNNQWALAEQLAEAGFTQGNFPTEEDYQFEKDRNKAMKFVEENYPGIKIIPFEEFATVEEATKYIEEADRPLVLQSKGDYCSTVVPTSDDPEQAKAQILNSLEKNKADYEKGGLISKDKLIRPVEITPQIVFYNGQPVYTDVDLETKNIGDGENNGNQVGCGSNLIIRTDLKDKINQLSFPKAVYDLAKEHKGIFVWDISLYLMPNGDIFFGEFCPNRFGYDAVMTEMTMSGGASKFFSAILAGENPLKDEFGTGVRLFNLTRKDGTQISWDEKFDPFVWLYEVKEEKGEIVSIGNCWDLGVATASANSITEAVDKLYNVVDGISFKELYTRTKGDFLAEYPTSIMSRYAEFIDKFYKKKLLSK